MPKLRPLLEILSVLQQQKPKTGDGCRRSELSEHCDATMLVKPWYAARASGAYLNMPYVFGDSQSVPKWMPGGNAATAAVYEKSVRVGMWAVRAVHEHNMHSWERIYTFTWPRLCVCVCAHLLGVRQTLGISTRLNHFNNFTSTNEWISFYRSYFIRQR